jgi:hypothetical protein
LADLSDVEEAFCTLVESAIYPTGATGSSVTGLTTKIYRGWPTNRNLNADLSAGTVTVTVFSKPNSSRDTSRYPRTWKPVSRTAPTLIASVSGTSVTLSGPVAPGQTVGVIVDGVGYAYGVTAQDTLAKIAASLADIIPDASSNDVVLEVPRARTLAARVAGSGSSIMETRRQEQGFVISVWAPNPASRDATASLVDMRLSDVDWMSLKDGSSGRLRYLGTSESDASEVANLYKRDIDYIVEYPTTITQTSSEMLFGIGILGDSGSTVGFSCLSPPDQLVLPPLGAIRFDAWYDPDNAVDQQCAAALSPATFNFRLPSNASVTGGGASWPRATQSTMDAEIAAAAQAGLTFWAFDSYQPDDTLSLALSLYLSSSIRSRMKFCMLGQTSNWGEGGADQPSLLRDIKMMTQPDYMTVLEGRPLYLVLDASADQTSGLPPGGIPTAIRYVRQAVMAAGGQNPYIVWLSGAALVDYDNTSAARAAGADAAGAYATPRLNGTAQPYGALVQATEADWTGRQQVGFPMIHTAMTGWDQRPLVETRQPFYPLSSNLTKDNYYETASSAAIGQHIAELAMRIIAEPASNPSQIGLIYAWNELAEGGWLMPTFSEQGANLDRVAAVGRALTNAVEQSRVPSIALVN